MKSLACVLNGHELCHEATNGDYRNCKGCILHKSFIDNRRTKFLIKGHCKFCKMGGLAGAEVWLKVIKDRKICPKGYAVSYSL